MTLLRSRKLLAFALALVVAAGVGGCRRAPPISPEPPDVAGRVAGHGYDVRSGGVGGLARLTVAVPASESRVFSRAYLWIDSATQFVGAAKDSIDWRMPRLRDAYVRVWFRGSPSTPNNDEIWAKARIVAIDSARPRPLPQPTDTSGSH